MNTFLHPITVTNFGNYKPEDVSGAIEFLEKTTQENLEKVVNVTKEARNFENTMLGFSRAGDQYMYVATMVSHLQSVLGSEWDEAEQFTMENATAFFTDVSQDKRFYDALVELREISAGSLSSHENRLLNETIEDFELNGILLNADAKKRQKEISLELSRLSTEFGQNVTKSDNAAGIKIETEDELDGLDEELIEEFAIDAKERGEKGFYIAYSPPNSEKVLGFATSRKTRSAYSNMTLTKNAGKNGEVAKQILTLRRELAEILGFSNHADMQLHRRMAKNGVTALKFTQNLRMKYQKKALDEHAELEAFARDIEGDQTLELDLHESFGAQSNYYPRLLKAKKYSVDEKSLNDYFEIGNVMSAMFDVLSTMYSVRFEEDKVLDVWHDDVEAYRIYNQENALIAIVRCDWYYRKGKRPGAWMNSIYEASRSGSDLSEPHTGIVIGNLPGATKSKPSLMSLRDIETIWHEFGHFMHFAFSNTELKEQSMMNVKWDFVEAPSQIMENFIWEPEILNKFAKHYKTGEPIPDSEIKKLKEARHFRAPSSVMVQSVFAETDLLLHMDYDPNSDLKVEDYAREHKNKLSPVKTPDFDDRILSFLHIFSGGYDAAYYSYKWAEVIQADLYTRFADEGVLNPKTGAEYRDLVLARGDEAEPAVLIRDFLGRDSNQDAMLKADGVL